MESCFSRKIILLIGLLASYSVGSTQVLAQSTQLSRNNDYTPALTANSRPNLEGIWQVLNTAAWDIEDHNDSLGVPAGKGVVMGDIPYQPWASDKKQENFLNRETIDPEVQCFLPGVPRITYMPHPFQIFQKEQKITIIYEYRNTVRFLHTNDTDHPEGPIEWYMGDSRAHWEGNTLVVDVVHFTEQTWFDRAGNFHSNELHVIERYTPTGPDHLLYEVSIEDPLVFTEPWSMSMPLYRRMDTNMEILEYECSAHMIEEGWNNQDEYPIFSK